MNKQRIALLEDLQNAKEGSRKLSDRCLWHIGLKASLRWPNRADPTRSVDDALDCMVPEGWHLRDGTTPDASNVDHPHGFASLYPNVDNPKGDLLGGFTGMAATFPLAICITRIKQLIGECND